MSQEGKGVVTGIYDHLRFWACDPLVSLRLHLPKQWVRHDLSLDLAWLLLAWQNEEGQMLLMLLTPFFSPRIVSSIHWSSILFRRLSWLTRVRSEWAASTKQRFLTGWQKVSGAAGPCHRAKHISLAGLSLRECGGPVALIASP